jgi:predicted transcriptional regulator
MFLLIGSGSKAIRKSADEIGISHKHAGLLIAQWMKEGLIAREGRGKYVYTAKGLEMQMIVQELEQNLETREFT